ncbi:hypothetical protein FSW04_09765 [Baekduia soli]|uniref:Uncharacterized protein n=1 Tax=Baekduia soli TaxID=496014 RepID=A0A5B8U4C8_9ACTN|nr:hypothetical protein FSW04_09765 [Baekduia soli]
MAGSSVVVAGAEDASLEPASGLGAGALSGTMGGTGAGTGAGAGAAGGEERATSTGALASLGAVGLRNEPNSTPAASRPITAIAATRGAGIDQPSGGASAWSSASVEAMAPTEPSRPAMPGGSAPCRAPQSRQ